MTRSTTEAYQGTTWCRSLDRFNDVTGTNDVRAIRQYLSHTFSYSKKHRHCSLGELPFSFAPRFVLHLWFYYPNISQYWWLMLVIYSYTSQYCWFYHVISYLRYTIPIYPNILSQISSCYWLYIPFLWVNVRYSLHDLPMVSGWPRCNAAMAENSSYVEGRHETRKGPIS